MVENILGRRSFLQVGTLGLAGLGVNLPSLAAPTTLSNGGHKKSVIFIFLSGGMAGQESFNVYEQNAVIEKNRSTTGTIKTKSGFLLGNHWDNLAEISDKFSLVHSFHTNNSAHGQSSKYVNSGYNTNDEDGPIGHPSYGSIISRVCGTNGKDTGIPNYVATSRQLWQGAAYAGSSYGPFTVDGEGKKSMGLNIEEQRFLDRFNTLNQLDNKFKDLKSVSIQDDYKIQAFNVVLGESSKVFNVNLESDKVKEQYGKNDFGQNCLLARRLVENGVKYVTITHNGWDMHAQIKNGMEKLVPVVDKGIAALLSDLSERGLLESTLVVVTTEFSRTYINATQGRDHQSTLCPLLLAGSSYGGSTIGTMDKDAYVSKDKPFMPINLLNTILTHVEIPLNGQFTDFSGRPRFLVEGQDKRIIA